MDHGRDTAEKDEEIFKERVYLSGKETQLQRLTKSLLGFYNKLEKSTYEESYFDYQAVLRELSFVEMSLEKANIVSSISDRELKEYSQLYKEREDDIQQVKDEIAQLKTQLAFERTERAHREEYASLTQILSQHPSVSKQQSVVQDLKNEIANLTNQSKQIQSKLDLRSKQFQLMLSALHSLQENDEIASESVDKNSIVTEGANIDTTSTENSNNNNNNATTINTNTDSMMTDEDLSKRNDTDVIMAT